MLAGSRSFSLLALDGSNPTALSLMKLICHHLPSLEIDGEPFLVGKGVAEILGYTNPRKALIDHINSEDKGVTKCDTLAVRNAAGSRA